MKTGTSERQSVGRISSRGKNQGVTSPASACRPPGNEVSGDETNCNPSPLREPRDKRLSLHGHFSEATMIHPFGFPPGPSVRLRSCSCAHS